MKLLIAATTVAGLLTLAACGSGAAVKAAPSPAGLSSPASSSAVAITSSASTTPTTAPPTPKPATTRTSISAHPTTSAAPKITAATSSAAPRTSASTPPAPSVPVAPVVPAGTGPVIVIDPGHSPTITSIDPATGLNVSDYANEPEMLDVFAVALEVRAKLIAAGYRVVMTKTSAYDRVSLAQRAAIANAAHAALAISIHDQAGSNGGIPFATGNNIVYYQAVGDYRATPAGKKVIFTDAEEAAVSKTYGGIFQAQRSAIEGHSVRLQSNVGYDLGSRGLAAGNIWIVQLLSHVPWIYNEAGGNSPGQAGLNATDKARYAAGLVASIERCVPATS